MKLTVFTSLVNILLLVSIILYYDVLPVNTSNNLWVADFVSQFIGFTSSGITLADYTSNLKSHKPVTSSGSYS
jgi:hypothetical protein